MITKEVLLLINAKLRSVTLNLVIIGFLFFVLATAILFFPQMLHYLFIIAFFVISFSAFLIAVKINHIKENFDKILKLVSKK